MRREIGAVLLLIACAPRRDAPPTREVVAQPTSLEEPVVSLERTPCFGGCPVYRIWVSASGEVGYEGRSHVRRVGTATGQLPVQRLQALLYELEWGGYFSFANRYTSAEPACGRYVTDSPSAITLVRLDGRTKRVVHDYGCGAAPGALTVLERRIDEVLNSTQWTGR